MRRRLVVIGGGAAGFFCAVNAARMQPGLEVIILEKTAKLLSKVKISGGGRCNVTHALFDGVEVSRRYPRGQHFVKKLFYQFSTDDTLKWFAARGVALRAEEDGRMFPVSNTSQTIVDCLLHEAGRYGVQIRLHASVEALRENNGQFTLTLSGGGTVTADFVCVASGGYPKEDMFHWLQQLGHTVVPPVPSLFTFNLPHHPITALPGVSVKNVRIKIEGSRLEEEGPVLLTHWGLSGPVVLRLSAWGARELAQRQYSFRIHLNWLPGFHDRRLKVMFQADRIKHATKKLGNYNPGLPARLWQFLLSHSGVSEAIRLGELPAKAENLLIRNLVDFVLEVKGKTTFKEEFVTAGGIALTEVDVHTMMSKKRPNLFFAGEVLDVDGITGGFNFQHAWSSGWVAAKSIGERVV